MHAPKGRPIDHQQFVAVRFRSRTWLIILGLLWLIMMLIVMSGSIYDWAFTRVDQLFGSQNTVVIAVQGPMTGPQADIGLAMLQGTQLAIDQQHGMVEQGRQLDITLEIYDDQSDPIIAIANARAISRSPDTLAIIGHADARTAQPAAEVYSRANLPVFYPAISSAQFVPLYPENSFFLLGEDSMQGRAAAELLIQHLAPSASGNAIDILVVADESDYSQRLTAAFTAALPADMLVVVKNVRLSASGSEAGVTYVRNAADIAALVDPASLDLIYFSADAKIASELAKWMVDQDKRVPIWGPDILNTPDLLTDTPDANSLIWYIAPIAQGTDYEEFRAAQFVTDYTARFGQEPLPYALEAYDAATVILRAIMDTYDAGDSQKPTRERLLKALKPADESKGEATSFIESLVNLGQPASRKNTVDVQFFIYGLNGPIEFDEAGRRSEVRFFVFMPELPAEGTLAWNRKITTITLTR